MLSVLCSLTTHFYGKISTTKINEWASGTFDISTCILLISHIHWLWTPVTKGPSIYQLSQFTYVIHVYICIQKQIAYKIKSIILSFHSQVFIHTLLTPLPHPLPLVFKRSVGVMVNYFVLLIFLHSSQFLDFSPSHQPIGHPSTRTAQSLSKASYKIAIV